MDREAVRFGDPSSRLSILRLTADEVGCDFDWSANSLPRSLTLLQTAIDRAKVAPDEERAASLDHAAARLVEAVLACGVPAGAVMPAQRTLLLLGRRPRRAPIAADPGPLLGALEDIFVGDPNEVGGFSRLLQSAIDAGEYAATESIDADEVDAEDLGTYEIVQGLVRRLSAVDDLSHALSVRADFPAALCVAHHLAHAVCDDPQVRPSDVTDLTIAWLAHRGVPDDLGDVVDVRDGATDLDSALVARASNLGLGQTRALTLWVLADQLANRIRPSDDVRDNWRLLLERARLAPLEVFDTADLWRTLDDEGTAI